VTPAGTLHPPASRAAADGELEAWAARIAGSLPPLTPTEAAAVGRLAAQVDARRGDTR
jgi:hypothetical protein